MSDIDITQVRKLDMTLLVVFAELVRHRKSTIVADRLGLTQSAISHSLRRLRSIFADELFLRRPNGLEPTARALAIEPKVLEILKLSSETFGLDRHFEPTTYEGTLRIGALDYEEAMFAAPLIDRFHAASPRMRLVFRSLVRTAALEALSAGELDVALGFYFDLGDNFECVELFREGYSVVARAGHPLLKQKLTPKRYSESAHLLVSLSGDLRGIVDTALSKHDLTRHVCASVPLFLPALATIGRTDLIGTIPSRLAAKYAKSFGLKATAPPIEVRAFPVHLVWHRRTTSDPALSWLRKELVSVVQRQAALKTEARSRSA